MNLYSSHTVPNNIISIYFWRELLFFWGSFVECLFVVGNIQKMTLQNFSNVAKYQQYVCAKITVSVCKLVRDHNAMCFHSRLLPFLTNNEPLESNNSNNNINGGKGKWWKNKKKATTHPRNIIYYINCEWWIEFHYFDREQKEGKTSKIVFSYIVVELVIISFTKG